MTTTITGATGINNIQAATGAVLQVVSSTLKSATAITSNSTNTFVSLGLSAAITPISTSSKILIQVNLVCGFTAGTFHFRIARGSDQTICIGDTGLSNQIRSTVSLREAGTPYVHTQTPVPMSFLDSPSTTAATTYQIMGTIGSEYANAIMYLNRPKEQDNGSYDARSTSTITLTEIAG